MANHTPQAPPAGRNPHDAKTHKDHKRDTSENTTEDAKVSAHDPRLRNQKEQGDQANIAQNTRIPPSRNQG